MRRRILTLTQYLLYRLLYSLTGLIYLVLAGAYYWIAFRTRTPEPDYFVLVIGFFGGLIAFFTTLSLAGRANEAKSYPFFMRLESRIEYLTALLLSAFIFSVTLQLLMSVVVLFRNGPEITTTTLIDLPPIWFSINVLSIVVAMHASDFVSRGWSRVWVFGLLAVLLLLGDGSSGLSRWLTDQLRNLSLQDAGDSPLLQQFQENLLVWADFISGEGGDVLGGLVSFVFWPIRAIINAELAGGSFTQAQAFAPAVLLLYATFLFLLASDYFASKDLMLTED
ncbi:MAG: hypothetical protein AAF633_21575 [Chloroflexota bacterium]